MQSIRSHSLIPKTDLENEKERKKEKKLFVDGVRPFSDEFSSKWYIALADERNTK